MSNEKDPRLNVNKRDYHSPQLTVLGPITLTTKSNVKDPVVPDNPALPAKRGSPINPVPVS
jgi:hypothetical protein